MPRATCDDCGKEISWSNKRGTRLSGLRCECGGRLHKPVAHHPGRRGPRRICVVCLRGRYTNVVTVPAPTEILYFGSLRAVKPGDPICWYGHGIPVTVPLTAEQASRMDSLASALEGA